MKKTRIIIEVDGELNEQERNDLPYLISDALFDFRRVRGESKVDAEAYINRRYPDGEGYSWLNREAKVEQVLRRTALAKRLHDGALIPKVEHEHDEDDGPCMECGEDTGDDGECGSCANCGVPLCCHGENYDKVAGKYDFPCDLWEEAPDRCVNCRRKITPELCVCGYSTHESVRAARTLNSAGLVEAAQNARELDDED
jgi:hypothetical protein